MTHEVMPPRGSAGQPPRAGCRRRRVAACLLAAAMGLAACDDGATAGGALPNGEDLSPRVMQMCGESLPKVDCGCFWKNAQAAFNAGNLDPLLQALAERERWGGQITRVRMEKVAGPEAARTINRALFDCTRL